jgi:hypothetical protein
MTDVMQEEKIKMKCGIEKILLDLLEVSPTTQNCLTFGPSDPFLAIFLNSTQSKPHPIWKPMLQSTKHKRNQLATLKHADAVARQSQKIQSIQNSALKAIYVRARASLGVARNRKENFFKISLLPYLKIR